MKLLNLRSFAQTIGIMIALTACGGGDGDGPADNLLLPSINPSPNTSLEELYRNTFVTSGISITVNPTTLDLGTTTQKNKKSANFVLTNGTKQEHNFTIRILDTLGGFSLVEGNGFSAYKPLVLGPNASQSITLAFDASLLGTKVGRIEITSAGHPHFIHLPFRAIVRGATDYRIVSSSYLCSNSAAEPLQTIDFMKVTTGTDRQISFKICNTGGKAIKINAVKFAPSTTGLKSKAADQDDFEPFEWDVLDTLNQQFFTYFIPNETKPFTPPERIPYTGPAPDQVDAFRVLYWDKNHQPKPAQNIVIEPNSFVTLTTQFKPKVEAEASAGKAFVPISFAAQMEISSSLGIDTIDTVGATGGREPHLKIVKRVANDTSPNSTPTDPCNTYPEINIESDHAALAFDPVEIYSDWIPEDFDTQELLFCNVGSGSTPLEVWMDPIDEGYFSIQQINPAPTFPLTIPAGDYRSLKLIYSPTPPNNKIESGWDFGQTHLRHTGGNGPEEKMLLYGEQDTENARASIIDVFFGDTRLRNVTRPYSESKRQNLNCVTIENSTDKTFTIRNKSRLYNLNSEIEASALTMTNDDGSDELPVNAIVSVTPNQLETAPQTDQKFTLKIELNQDLPEGTALDGVFTITNSFEAPPAQTPPSYQVYYRVFTSKTQECKISGVGQPLDGPAIVVIDRITMNMLGLDDPARNPPSFKFHLPIDLDLKNERARIHGLPYDPTKKIGPTQQIRSYAHQISNVGLCYPLPTNPYRLEFESGSWDGPRKTCNFQSDRDTEVKVMGSAICMDNNGTQKFTDPNTGEELNVFYHEFVKLGDECNVAFEGKISTFILKNGEDIGAVFQRMQDEFGSEGTQADYDQITRPFSFNSYITFNEAINLEGCTYPANTTIEDANQLEACWEAFKKNGADFTRTQGMVEECSYFQFDIEPGCGPNDLDEERCANVDLDDPDTWKGYGEYEVNPDDDTKYELTIRNVHIRAFTLVHSLNAFFGHAGRLLFSDLYVTLTTRAIGEDSSDPYDLIGNDSRVNFELDDFVRTVDSITNLFWINDGTNNSFSVGTPGEFDDIPCAPNDPDQEDCRGNFKYLSPSQILHAGAPINLDDEHRRLMLVGLGAFRGKGNLAPSFARELPGGKGAPLYFTFHACLKETTLDDDGNLLPLDESVGCYDRALDNDLTPNGQLVREVYKQRGILTQDDLDEDNGSRAFINFRIFDEDRNRLTDYYNYPSHFKFNSGNKTDKQCGYGN